MGCEALRRLMILPSGNKTRFNGWSLPRFNSHIKVKNWNKKCSDWICSLWRATLPGITSSPLRCPSGQKHWQHRERHQHHVSVNQIKNHHQSAEQTSQIHLHHWRLKTLQQLRSILNIPSVLICQLTYTADYIPVSNELVTLVIIYSFIHTDLMDANLQN